MIKVQTSLENTRSASESGFYFDDWKLPEEKQSTDDSVLFEGKIIARMPDLGSVKKVSLAEELKKQPASERTNPSLKEQSLTDMHLTDQRILSEFRKKWAGFVLSIRSVTESRKKLFQCIAACGGLVVLCGIVILFLDQDNDELPTTSVVHHADADSGVLPEFSQPLSAYSADRSLSESAFSPIIVSDSAAPVTSLPPVSFVPIADASALPDSASITAADQPVQGKSVWDRPNSDSYSPWIVASRQTEILRSPPPSHFITAEPTSDDPAAIDLTSSNVAVSVTPIENPSTPVTMTPMTPLHSSMPFSPHERHLVARSSVSSSNTYSYMPISTTPIPSTYQPLARGMMPMHDRLEYTTGISASQNYHQPTQQTGYAPTQPYPQGGAMPVPMGSPQRGGSSQRLHDQYNQYPIYAGSNVPIPSGPSTLSQLPTGYPSHTLPYGYGQEMNPEQGFYSPPPPMYKRY